MRALLLCLVVSFLHSISLALENPEDLLSQPLWLNSKDDLSLKTDKLSENFIKTLLKKYVRSGDQVEISNLNNLNEGEDKPKRFKVRWSRIENENNGTNPGRRRTKKYRVVINRRTKYNKSDANVDPKYYLHSKQNYDYYPIIKNLIPDFKHQDSVKSIVTKLNDDRTVIPIKENEFIAKVSETQLPYELETNNRENDQISKKVPNDNNLHKLHNVMHEYAHKITELPKIKQNGGNQVIWEILRSEKKLPIKEEKNIVKVPSLRVPFESLPTFYSNKKYKYLQYEPEINNRENNQISKQVPKDNNRQINHLLREYVTELLKKLPMKGKNKQNGNNQIELEVLRDDKLPIEEEEIIVPSIQASNGSLHTNDKYKYQILSEPDVKIAEQKVQNDLIPKKQIATVSNPNKLNHSLDLDKKEELPRNPSYEVQSPTVSEEYISTFDEKASLENDDQSSTKNTGDGDNQFFRDRLLWLLHSSKGIQESIQKLQLLGLQNILLQLCKQLGNAPDFGTFLNHYLGLDQPQISKQFKNVNIYLKNLLKLIQDSNLHSIPAFVLLQQISDYIDRTIGVEGVRKDKSESQNTLRNILPNIEENSYLNNEKGYNWNELYSALLRPHSAIREEHTLDSSKDTENVSVNNRHYQSVKPIVLEVTTPGSIKEPDIASKRIFISGGEGFGRVPNYNDKTADSIVTYFINNEDSPVGTVVANNTNIKDGMVLNNRFKELKNNQALEGEPEKFVTDLPEEAVVDEKPTDNVRTEDLKIPVVLQNNADIENLTEESKNSNDLQSLEMGYEDSDWLYSNSKNPSVFSNEDFARSPEVQQPITYTNEAKPLADKRSEIYKSQKTTPNVLSNGDLQQIQEVLEIAGINLNQKSKGKHELQYLIDLVPYEQAEKVIQTAINKTIQLLKARNVPIESIDSIIRKIMFYVLHTIEDHAVKCPAKVRYDNFAKKLEEQVSNDIRGIGNTGQNAKLNRRMLQDILGSSSFNYILQELFRLLQNVK